MQLDSSAIRVCMHKRMARRGAAAAARARPRQQGQWHAPLPLAHRNSIFKSRPQKNGGRLHSAAAPRRVYGELIKHASTFFYEFFLRINNSVTERLQLCCVQYAACWKLISCFIMLLNFCTGIVYGATSMSVTVLEEPIKLNRWYLYNVAAYLTRNAPTLL